MPCCEESKPKQEAVDSYSNWALLTWQPSLPVISAQAPDTRVKKSPDGSSLSWVPDGGEHKLLSPSLPCPNSSPTNLWPEIALVLYHWIWDSLLNSKWKWQQHPWCSDNALLEVNLGNRRWVVWPYNLLFNLEYFWKFKGALLIYVSQ